MRNSLKTNSAKNHFDVINSLFFIKYSIQSCRLRSGAHINYEPIFNKQVR